jgi:hypothetical protein
VDEAGTLGKPGAAYKTGELSRDQSWKLLQTIPREQFLPARLLDALGQKVGNVFAVGEKDYAANLFGGPLCLVHRDAPNPNDGPPVHADRRQCPRVHRVECPLHRRLCEKR